MASSHGRAAAASILDLYRKILRIHQAKLAGPLKDLGHDYVRSEFRSHLRGKTSREQWTQFVAQWEDYHSFLNGTADAKAPMVKSTGELSEEILEAMSPDQRKRMEMLREEASKLVGRESTPLA